MELVGNPQRGQWEIFLCLTAPSSEITLEIELGESVKDGVQHKRLWVRVSCDGAIGEHSEDQPLTAFPNDEHAISWVQYMIAYLNRHLPERLRTMALLTVREAIAKSSELHHIAETDWKKFAEGQARILERQLKKSHGVSAGPDRIFKTKQQYLNFLGEAARVCKTRGEQFTQEWIAEFASKKFNKEKPIDERMIRQWNKDWRVNWDWYVAKVNRRN